MPDVTPVNALHRDQLDERLCIGNDFGGRCLSLAGPIVHGLDDLIRIHAEELKQEEPNNDSLVVVLTTNGGYVDVVQRIVETLRHHYGRIDYVVPNYAFSAGTVLAMSGDNIHMDYYSRLGPIDPQVKSRHGDDVPALGYLRQYERLMEKADAGTINAAEVNLLIDGFDQATLYKYEQAKELSKTLLGKWLATYKFKNWTVTETRKKMVTDEMREERAHEIADNLNDTDKWHIHGRGISKDELDRDLDLKIDDFGAKPDRHKAIREYHKLFDDYIARRGQNGVVHTAGRYTPYI